MDLIAYSKGLIRFIPTGKRDVQDEYSERSIIELRENGCDDYSLRALDMEQQPKKEIFNFSLRKINAYEFGPSDNARDRIRSNLGIYFLLLNKDTRNQFHNALKTCMTQINLMKQGSLDVDSGKPIANDSSTEGIDSRTIADGNVILTDIHKLGEYIQNGKENKAAEMVEKFIKKGVRLQFEKSKGLSNEQTFPVKIDGIESKIKDKDETLSLDVYPSTKVHELQALFEYTHGFLLTNQYFFVNGHLAYTESTMSDLCVTNNSLFVLFVTEEYERF